MSNQWTDTCHGVDRYMSTEWISTGHSMRMDGLFSLSGWIHVYSLDGTYHYVCLISEWIHATEWMGTCLLSGFVFLTQWVDTCLLSG